jgi:hypothetical protein
MFDKNSRDDVLAALENILFSLRLIRERFAFIETSDDFLESTEGLEHLDSISMSL